MFAETTINCWVLSRAGVDGLESECSSSDRPEHRPGAGGPGSYIPDTYESLNTRSLTCSFS